MMDNIQKANLSSDILRVIRDLQRESELWVDFARIGAPLTAAGIQYKQFGYAKLRPFLNEFQDILEFKDVQIDGKPPVCYVRPKDDTDPLNQNMSKASQGNAQDINRESGKIPSTDSWLFNWARIPGQKIDKLSKLALEERWYYGETLPEDQNNLPILRSYLAYTFKRLCFEKKVLVEVDKERNEEYAAFNTGLVDKKYEYIYALFKKNTLYPTPYWYLLDFVVAGEDIGKTLIKVFNPLPERADYFENKIQNMLYDTSTGDLSCDYIHIITERTDRLPIDFLKENCSSDFLSVEGVEIDDIYSKPIKDEARKQYFKNLGNKINNDTRILNRIKNRIADAVDLSKKRVEWNYKTAIPMYYPTKNTGSLLLPLSLMDEDRVDLALVVERQASGAYQGQTILPLNLAYSNSRLVTRPDSDWLKTDIINMSDSSDLDDDQ